MMLISTPMLEMIRSTSWTQLGKNASAVQAVRGSGRPLIRDVAARKIQNILTRELEAQTTKKHIPRSNLTLRRRTGHRRKTLYGVATTVPRRHQSFLKVRLGAGAVPEWML